MTIYLDASAAAKLLVMEAETAALVAHLQAPEPRRELLVSSALLETELRRLAVRVGLEQPAVSEVLRIFVLADPDRAVFTAAGLMPGRALRSLDALHVATALRLEVSAFVTYDERQATAAADAGLMVVAPA